MTTMTRFGILIGFIDEICAVIMRRRKKINGTYRQTAGHGYTVPLSDSLV